MKYQDGELSCKIMISSHVKISLLLWLHNKLHLSRKCFGISLVFIQQVKPFMAAWRYENSLRVLKIISLIPCTLCGCTGVQGLSKMVKLEQSKRTASQFTSTDYKEVHFYMEKTVHTSIKWPL